MLTKGLFGTQLQKIILKLGMDDIHAPTWGGVLLGCV